MKEPTGKRYTPDELLDRFYSIRNGISDVEFFNDPKHKKTQEMWCAAHFARAMSANGEQYAVQISDNDEQQAEDFSLVLADRLLPVQVTEVQADGRKRGAEYKKGVPGPFDDEAYSMGSKDGAQWVKSAIEKKAGRNYANQEELNLLVYVNFAAWDQQYADYVEICKEAAANFRSVWLISGNSICCIKAPSGEQATQGWQQIGESVQ